MSQTIRKSTKTTRPTTTGLQRDFYLLDASKQPLGRIATEAARLLIGKNLATYSPDVNMGAVVVIINADKTVLTGQKSLRKNYFNYSGKMSGLRVRSFPEVMAKDSTEPLYRAIKGMLPKNRHRDVWANQLLHIFKGEHNLPNKMISAN
jgi:large subunit ribosomal protein L13